jgi:peptidylprolyl isomerase
VPIPRSRGRSVRPAVCVLLLALLTGCVTPVRSAPTAPTRRTVNDLARVEVTGRFGREPTVKVPTPFAVGKTVRTVLTKGAGPRVTKGQRVTVDYLGVNGADGREFNSSFGATPSTFILDPGQYLPGLVTAVTGTTVGSRVLVAIPPADAYGVNGQPSAGIGPTDTIVVVVDVRSAGDVLTRAEGTPVAPRPGLPTVTSEGAGEPKIELPRGAAPTTLVVQPLIAGKGARVRKGQQITVQYTGVIWPGGRQFDSSWDRDTPAVFPIGLGQVVAGWDEGLVGQRVGSRVLLVLPPDKGYGAAGRPSSRIKGTDTLVFVVDVLGAG